MANENLESKRWFIAIAAVVNPEMTFDTSSATILENARVSMFIGAVIAVAVYAALAHVMYKNMVRGFDMILRKQSQ